MGSFDFKDFDDNEDGGDLGAMEGDWVLWTGLACLWAAAALTVMTGWAYLRIGLRHMA